jgi:hypothetical protein
MRVKPKDIILAYQRRGKATLAAKELKNSSLYSIQMG